MLQELTHEDTMARAPQNPADNLEWVDALSFEELATIKEAVSHKMDSLKHEVKAQLKDDLMAKLQLYGFTPQELGLGTPAKATSKATGGKKREVDTTKPCPICEFLTEPHHDGRHHRRQGEDKRPYTDEELEELGMVRVEHAHSD